MREQAQRIAGRLEATLRVPDVPPRASVVIAHALPTHGGTMRGPLIAAIARACAERGMYALRFNFRGVGASAGEWSGGRDEPQDVGYAVTHMREFAPRLPLAAVGYSFGALMTLRWMERGGRLDAYALVGLPLRSVSLAAHELPPVPDATFVVAASDDQFGTAAELRAAYPRIEVREVGGVDHYFVGRHRDVGAIVAERIAKDLRLTSPLP
jgi:hypothetical protein